MIEIERENQFKADMELPDRKASRIVATAKQKWQSVVEQKHCFDWLCDHAMKIRKVFVKYA